MQISTFGFHLQTSLWCLRAAHGSGTDDHRAQTVRPTQTASAPHPHDGFSSSRVPQNLLDAFEKTHHQAQARFRRRLPQTSPRVTAPAATPVTTPTPATPEPPPFDPCWTTAQASALTCWHTLTQDERVETALAAALSAQDDRPFETVLQRVHAIAETLAAQWLRRTLSTQPPAENIPEDNDTRRVAALAPALSAWLNAPCPHDLQSAVIVAMRLLADERAPIPCTADGASLGNLTTPAHRENLFQAQRFARKLDRATLPGVDSETAAVASLHSAQALLQYQHPEIPLPLEDSHAIWIAAALHSPVTLSQNQTGDADPTQPYRLALRKEKARLHHLSHFLPLGNRSATHGRAWFDGLAIRDAMGATLADVTDKFMAHPPPRNHRNVRTSEASQITRQRRSPPAHSDSAFILYGLPPEPLMARGKPREHHAMREAFQQKMTARYRTLTESTRFPAGTPPQSIDTIVQRLGPMHNISLSQESTFAAVLNDFRLLCAAWQQRPAFWFSPSLAAAIHLARASDTFDPPDASRWNETQARSADTVLFEAQLIADFHDRLRAYAAFPALQRHRLLLMLWHHEDRMSWPLLLSKHRIPCVPTFTGLSSTTFSGCFGSKLQEYERLRNFGRSDSRIQIGNASLLVHDQEARIRRSLLRDINRSPITQAKARELLLLSGAPYDAVAVNDTIAALSDAYTVTVMVAPVPVSDPIRATTESSVIVSRWPAKIDQALQEKNAASIVGLIPFTAPLHLIGETIAHGRNDAGKRGALQLGQTLLTGWMASTAQNCAQASPASWTGPAIKGLDADRQSAHRMLCTALGLLQESTPATIPLRQRQPLTPQLAWRHPVRASPPLYLKQQLPVAWRGRAIAVRLANGIPAYMVFLHQEKRFAAVSLSAATIFEMSWQGRLTGTLNGDQINAVSNGELADIAQKSAGPATNAADQEDTRATDTAQRTTVGAIRQWLASLTRNATDALPLISFDNYLHVDTGQALQIEIAETLARLCRLSPTLRLITASAPSECWPLRFVAQPGSALRFDLASVNITLPSASAITRANRQYPGAYGLVQFVPQSVWLHAFLQAVTGLPDPPVQYARGHRGPLIYLMDRILYEANAATPAHLVHTAPHNISAGAASLAPLTSARHRENQILDALLTALIPVTPDDAILGEPVVARATVIAALQIEAALRASAQNTTRTAAFLHDVRDFRERLIAHAGQFHAGDHDAWTQLHYLRAFLNVADALYARSVWNRRLLDHWLSEASPPRWRILHERAFNTPVLEKPFHLTRVDYRIEMTASAGFSYLSADGLRPFSYQRRVAAVLAELAMPAQVMQSVRHDRYERGAAVYIENKLLARDSGSRSDSDSDSDRDADDASRRVCARSWNMDFAQNTVDPDTARRVADDEDRYIRQALQQAGSAE